MSPEVPKEALKVIFELEKRGFEAYVVGGCVRDLYIGKEPEDWDVATNATPEEVQRVFPDNFYENEFFTVTVLTGSGNPTLKEVEITTYRADFEYKDRRRPGKVEYAKTIEEDLSRRDFTVNAMALGRKFQIPRLRQPAFVRSADRDFGRTPPDPLATERGQANPKSQYKLVDPFGGERDIKRKLLRAVGDPKKRFQEDALRMMRGVRLASVLGFAIEEKTKEAIVEHAVLLKDISAERLRDELVKIIMSPRAMEGIEMLRILGLLRHIMPELEEGWGVGQNKHHIYSVWEHNLRALEYAAKKGWSAQVRLASLLHDVGKPRVKKGDGYNSTFYAHEVVGASMARKILDRLKFSKADVEKMANLVRYHLFYYNAGEVTEASVRRLMKNIGKENAEDLLQVRMADRIGSGVPKAEPYKLRHLRYIIDKVSQDPISAKMLAVNGADIMRVGHIEAGPRVGHALAALLEEVLEDPMKNTKEYLEKRALWLLSLPAEELLLRGEQGKKEKEKVETKRDEVIKQKYFVR